jgi:hypothetical protein
VLYLASEVAGEVAMAQAPVPAPMTVTAGSALSVFPAGNLLLGSVFLDTDTIGVTVRFSVPPVTGFSLDPGGGWQRRGRRGYAP